MGEPRALHVLGGLNPGGVERWLRDSVRYRGASRWRFDFCLLGAAGGAYEPEVEALGCSVLACPLFPLLTFPSRLLSLLRQGRYAVVHSHVDLFSGLVLALAAAAGVPVRAAHGHTPDHPRSNFATRYAYTRLMRALLFRSMTLGFACSPAAANFAGAALARRLRPLPCGIDLGRLRSARVDATAWRRRFNISLDAAVIGHVGRLAPEKNQTFLLSIARHLVNQIPEVRFVIVGSGVLEQELKERTRCLGLQRYFLFTGASECVPELLTGVFDAFVLPSLREGLPAAALEAQAAGLPAVLSDCVPAETVVLPEIVERKALGEGAAAWAGALCRALQRRRWDREDVCRRLERRGLDVADAFRTLTDAYEQAGAG